MGISLLSDSEIKEFGTLNELKPDDIFCGFLWKSYT